MDAYAHKEVRLADFYRKRFREEFKPAVEGSRDIQHATNYVLGVVLFSAALFFGGISTRLGNPRTRAVVLGIGCAVLLGTVTWMATFPVSLSV